MQDKNRKLQFIFHSPYQNILNIYIDRRKSYTPYTEVSKIVITFVSPTTYNFPQKTPHPTLILHDPTLNVMRRSFAIPSPRRLPSRTAPIPPSFSTTKNTPFSTPIFDAKTTIQKAPRKHTILTGPSRLGIPRLRNTERQRRTQDLGPVIPPLQRFPKLKPKGGRMRTPISSLCRRMACLPTAPALRLAVSILFTAHPHGVSGNAYGSTSGSSDTQDRHAVVTADVPASGSLTKANPETPPFSCRCRKLPLLRAKDTMPGDASTPGLRFDPAAPAPPPFCDQTRHTMYLDVPNTKEEDTAVYLTRQRLPDNQTTDPRRVPVRTRVFIPKR